MYLPRKSGLRTQASSLQETIWGNQCLMALPHLSLAGRVEMPFAGNAYNASSKAALVSAAANSLGDSGYGPYGNAPGFLDGLSRDNPAAWFNLSNALVAIDPPGEEPNHATKCLSTHCVYNGAGLGLFWRTGSILGLPFFSSRRRTA